MLETARANLEQPEHQPREARAAVVVGDGGQRGAQPAPHVHVSEVAGDELKAAVRGHLLDHSRGPTGYGVLDPWLSRFSFTISRRKLKTFGFLGSTLARTQCASG